MSCTSCGSNNIEYDGASGSSYCNVCGLVLEESAIVSELTFGESSSGAAILQGSYVSADKGRISLHGPYKRGGMESREQTIENGRRRIQQMATALRLPERYQESAQRYYNLAVTNNFVKGRRTQNVVAVCLYVVCRMEKSNHMLIDFSELLQINVFTLGSTFLKFVRILHLTVPLIDPSLYISRFAAMMELGDHTQRVAQDAVLLVQRMDRDWIHTGRRPSGICGACLLIAARLNGFRRTQREIVTIVKVAEVTLKKRLNEFKLTPSSNLSVRDFRSVWLEEEWDPPAFTAARKKQRLLVDRTAAGSVASSSRKRKSVRFNKSDDDDDDKEPEEDEEDEDGDGDGDEDEDEVGENQDRAEDMFQIDRVAVEDVMAAVVAADVTGPSAVEEEDVALEAEMDEVMRDERLSKLAVDIEERWRGEERERRQKEELGSLSDVDDDEIESVILNEQEIVLKTRVWYEFNKEYLEEQAVKRRKEEEEKRNGVHRNKGKRKPKRPSGPSGPAATPAEAARQMLQTKRTSRKIDYSKLEALFETPDGVLELKSANPSRHTTPRSPSAAAATTPLPHPPTALQTLLRTGVRFPFLQGLVEEDGGGTGGTYEADDGYEVVDETGVEVGVRVKRPRVPTLPAKSKEATAGVGAGTGAEAEDEEEETVGEEERLMLEARRALGYEVEEEGDYWDDYNEDD